MDETTNQFARKTYIVNKGFQLRFSFLIFIATFAIGTIAVWTTYVTTWNAIAQQVQSRAFYENIRAVYEKENDSERSASMINALVTVEFSGIFDTVSSILAIRILVASFLLFVLSIFASHKIAGPLWRIKNAAHSIRDGDLSVDISRLRAGDEMAELAQAINGAIGKLRLLMDRYRVMAKKLAELTAKIAAYNEGGTSASEETTLLIKELEVVSTQLVAEMNYFKTTKQKVDDALSGRDAAGEIRHY